MDSSTGAGLLSSPPDLLHHPNNTATHDSAPSTNPTAQRHSPWPLGPSPGAEGSSPAGNGTPAAVNGGVATGAFSPRLGEGQYSAGSRAPGFYGTDTGNSPPRLQPSNDYRSASG